MSRVLTFSRNFPAYHPKKGQQTFFVEKITKNLHKQGLKPWDIPDEIFNTEMYNIVEGKGHTIRAGHRWKAGDKFSPRVWSGKPYQSKQIIIAPDIEVKKVWNFECKSDGLFYINGKWVDVTSSDIPKNDGLSDDDFLSWFPVNKPLDGQIICWDETIEY